MTRATLTGHRTASAAVLVVGGGAVAAAVWIGGDHGFAVALVAFYVLVAALVYAWSGGQGDIAAIMRVGGDERQRGLDRDANAITGYVVSFAAITGVIVQTARGEGPGGYGVMCVVAGVSYVVSLTALRLRR
ncbi:MAG TPA: hypothetical protein VGP92_09760 [Acidimicrobiia bacterium]|jgi:hypothetical protein|nr:hypothetical protein [Acidimicrobiia bacterium]